ncbi:hypothetical protein thsps21_23420 [Pseudomonas sp. No.21]
MAATQAANSTRRVQVRKLGRGKDMAIGYDFGWWQSDRQPPPKFPGGPQMTPLSNEE